MDAYTVLVVMLTVLLSIFLLVAIVAGYWMVKLLKQIHAITEQAQKVADNVEAVSEFFRHTAGPVAITRLVSNVVEMFSHRKKK